MRSKWISCGWLVLIAGVASASEPAAAPPEMLTDAELADVFFLDSDRGWAVGDRGVILATEDGGRRWTHCDSPVSCRLESIHFVDEHHGWAVGGWIHPYTHKTSSVVLRTDNGGRRWTRVSSATLPKLRKVYFSTKSDGWAIGNPSMMYPSGCFRSGDGGRSWSPVPTTLWTNWESACDDGQGNPLLIGAQASGSLRETRSVAVTPIPRLGLRNLRSIATSRQRLFAVGDGGVLLVSQDQGRSWSDAPSLPTAAAFDFRTVACQGSNVWVAGSPGTQLLHSPDEGLTWEWLSTGQSSDIQAVTFVDEHRGWAVGTLGTILATRDGGRTWIRQRGSSRVAMLAIFGAAEDVPLEFVADVGGNGGYRTVVDVIGRRDWEVGSLVEANREERLHEAIVTTGGVAGRSYWQFPVRQAGLNIPAESLVRGWDTAQQTDSLRRLEALLVRRIRQLQPTVVVTTPPGSPHEAPLSYIINQVTLAAVQRAADETAYPEHRFELGLSAWETQKVFSQTLDGDAGNLRLETTQLATRLGETLAAYAMNGRGLLQSEWSPPAARHGFRLLISELPRETARRDFFGGLKIETGSERRRDVGGATATDLASLRREAQQQRNIEHLLRYATSRGDSPVAWLAQTEQLIRDLPPATAGEVLFRMAAQFRAAGEIRLAAEMMQLLVERHPDHALTEEALVWLTGFMTSQEVRWGLLDGEAPERHLASTAAARQTNASTGVPAAQVAPASFVEQASGGLLDSMRATEPTLFSDPLLRAAAAAYYRQEGRLREAKHLYEQLAGSPAFDIWSRSARGELWQMSHKGLPPKAATECHLTEDKPYLNGKLTETLWATAMTIPLASIAGDDQTWAARGRLAYDREYLYVALECVKPNAEMPSESSSQTRSRDDDLQDFDRVELLLDIDRDYASFYRLVVDQRGHTFESCYGQKEWDPEWFVAVDDSAETWTVEAAIAWKDLTPQAPARGAVWSLGLQRTVPGRGFQSWTQPAGLEIRPEGFGYLQFR